MRPPLLVLEHQHPIQGDGISTALGNQLSPGALPNGLEWSEMDQLRDVGDEDDDGHKTHLSDPTMGKKSPRFSGGKHSTDPVTLRRPTKHGPY